MGIFNRSKSDTDTTASNPAQAAGARDRRRRRAGLGRPAGDYTIDPSHSRLGFLGPPRDGHHRPRRLR